MQHTPIVTEEKLHSHSDYAESHGLIPELLLRLICASVQNPIELRLPVGGSVGQRGWDGLLFSPIAFDPYVPKGQSFWEIGVGGNPEKKATDDFRKRTERTPDSDRATSAFVFVTARSAYHCWNSEAQSAWIKKHRESANWRDIRIIDGTKLVQWLYFFPEIDFWLADKFGLPTTGLSTPALHWKKLQRYGAPPDLKPEVFLSGREKAVEHVVKLFEGHSTELMLETRYPDEVIDFVAAALASLDLARQSAFAGRCLIINDSGAWQCMCSLQTPHVFVATPALDVGGTESDLRQQARTYRHAVIFAATPSGGSHGNAVRLPETKPHELVKALETCGYDSERARQISTKCDGRTTILKRLLLDLSASPDWASGGQAVGLALSILIGRWDANYADDRKAIESSLEIAYGEWIRIIRETALRPDPPLIQRDERWKFVSRFEAWQFLGPYISDDDLDRWRAIAVQVLAEKDPRLDLPNEKRWAANIHGIARRYSALLREGIAETLALLGSYPSSLNSCSVGKPELIAALTVREVLKDADWILWASLNDVLPLLAEAAPGEFLDAVDSSLMKSDGNPFRAVFAQERAGIMGANYMTGLLWGLETLAWHQNYLTRVAVTLAQLAAIDPGGNWANRPLNSLTTIFLPWFPQTCAPVSKRQAAVEAIRKEQPVVGWKLLLSLLPSSHQMSSETSKPTWREFIPLDRSEKVSIKEYWEQISIYADFAVQDAKTDPHRLSDLIDRIDDLPPLAHKQILDHLSSSAVLGMPESERCTLWEALVDLTTKHRKFSDAKWAMNPEVVEKIEAVSEKLKPSSPQLFYKRLFSDHDFNLMEEKGNYEEQRKELNRRREKAVEEIIRASGITSIVDFARCVAAPGKVGLALAGVAQPEVDDVILPHFLDNPEKPLDQFASGFVRGRFWRSGWPWFDALTLQAWLVAQKVAVLSLLPFESNAWRRAALLLGDEESAYWTRVPANPYDPKDHLQEAVEHLLKHGRGHAAIQCLDRLIDAKASIPIALVVRALEVTLTSQESLGSSDQYATLEVIKWLQDNRDVDSSTLARLEWSYLPALDRHLGASPRALERRLAEEPAFFCDVIRTVFKSRNLTEAPAEPSEAQKRIAENAYRLLQEWRTPPGSVADGSFNDSALKSWVSYVQKSCRESGHFEVSMTRVGHVLVYAPQDTGGLWLHRAAAEVLNASDAEEMRRGFSCELFNQRGVHSWTAGREELEIAKDYHKKADALDEQGFFRIASSVRELAKSYERDAQRQSAEDPFDR